ncbi:hypothetical protein LO771_18610 [Streptacidiphilus sp. ASG 303]|uniref:hypothetical protein n=1 Tax=Streptacidiphilus sp. ASG 303 TaxID=2896847 RepID=UPI001E521ED2|nr:hypothetical protein [Streptacidiphilus sp. ASG 303]MCD0484351.1 hypothetical protein [Streptacidiphilus sp. ASG 303]
MERTVRRRLEGVAAAAWSVVCVLDVVGLVGGRSGPLQWAGAAGAGIAAACFAAAAVRSGRRDGRTPQEGARGGGRQVDAPPPPPPSGGPR